MRAAGPAIAPIKPLAAAKPKKSDQYSLAMGVLGAFLGAGIGAGVMYGLSEMIGFRFPFLGVGIGALSGFGARWLAKGTDNTLGVITGGIALVAVCGTLYLIYGAVPMINIISMAVSVSVAYRIASA